VREHAHRYDDMWTISILRDDLQPLNGVLVSNNVVEYDGSVLFNPVGSVSRCERKRRESSPWKFIRDLCSIAHCSRRTVAFAIEDAFKLSRRDASIW